MTHEPTDDEKAAAGRAVSQQRSTTVADLDRADTLIDARTPAEFALDHIPGAINCPVLSNDERHIVGTIYKQQGPFEARRIGGAMVAANLSKHLRERFADRSKHWKPIVYCWRGGLRSGSMTQWLRLVGWDARQLAGGYKAWRHHVIGTMAERIPTLDFRVLTGPTGSGKTRVLEALATAGQQILDLEGCADHRGSVLGNLPGVEQPSQKRFETRVAQSMAAFDPGRPVYVEAESRKIGRIHVPDALLDRIRAAPCYAIEASVATRLAFLLREYAFLGDDRADLVAKIERLRGLQSNETLARWTAWAAAGELEPLFDELMRLHYDPLYRRSQEGSFERLRHAVRIEVDALDDAGTAGAAAAILTTPH